MMKKSLDATMCIYVIDVMIASPEKIFTNHGMRQRWKKFIKTCKDCREKRRISAKIRYDKNKDKINENKREERAKQSQFCEGCNQNVRHENWDEHFFWVRHSGSELNLLLKDFNKNFFNSSKTNEERDAIRQEYHRKKREIYQKLQEQFPNSKKWRIDE